MQVLIEIWGIPPTYSAPPKPLYLKSCDFEARGGLGDVVLTEDSKDAMRFDNATDALVYWRTQSVAVPLRGDGKPNRPLTAYSVTFSPAP